jgi:2-C-methyl-D-erythritol 4-phosphate cytidylyltransferase
VRRAASSANELTPWTDAEGRHALLFRPLLPDDTAITLHVVVGGSSRQESVERGLSQLGADVEIVLVHDVARFLTPARVFDDVVAAIVEGDDAVIPALPVVDTLKRVDADDLVVDTPARAELRVVQTPQGFRREVLESAHAEAASAGFSGVTDDAGLVERLGLPVRVVPGDDLAFKITRPVDLVLAEALVHRAEGTP